MPEYYQIPALALTILLAPAFGYLYLRFVTPAPCSGSRDFSSPSSHALHLPRRHVVLRRWPSSLGHRHRRCRRPNRRNVFLASLSPLRFRVGSSTFSTLCRTRSARHFTPFLFDGVFRGVTPRARSFGYFPRSAPCLSSQAFSGASPAAACHDG